MPLAPIDSWIRPQDESFTLVQGATQRITVADLIGNDTGLGGAIISLQSVNQPAHGSLALQADGSYLYTPAPGYVGPDSFTYVVGDQFGNLCTEGVEITIAQDLPNQAPWVQDEYVDVRAGVPVSAHESALLANDGDADGGSLSVGAYSQPAHGTLSRAADGTLTYTAHAGYEGADSFTYQVSDGQGGVTTGTVHFQVTKPVNQAPVVNNEFVAIVADTPVSAHESVLLGNDGDPEGGALTVKSLGQPANGSLVRAADGTLTYTPKPGFVGTDSFTYVVADAQGLTSTGTVTLQVNPNPNPPPPAAPTVTLVDDANSDGVISRAEVGRATHTDVRVDLPPGAAVGDELTVRDNAGHSSSYVLTSADITAGAVLFEGLFPLPAAGSTLTVSAKLTDARGNASGENSDSALFDGNFNPVAVDDTGMLRSYTPGFDRSAPQTSGNVLSNDTDPDGSAQALRVAGVATSAAVAVGQNVGQTLEGQWGHLTINADGSYTYVADKSAGLNAAVQDVFYYLPKDGGDAAGAAALAPAKLSITVDPAYQTVTGVIPPDAPATEGGDLVFSVAVPASPLPTTMSLEVLSGSGTAGLDTTTPLKVSFGGAWMNVVGNSITVPANTTYYQVRISTVDDALIETTETISLKVTTVSGSTAQAEGSIIDNDVARGQAYGTEDTALALSWANFNLGGLSGTPEKVIISSLPQDGALFLNGGAVTLFQAITKADIDAGRLAFYPDHNESGVDAYKTGGVGNLCADYAQFSFTAVDTKGLSYAGGTVTVDIAPTADLESLQVGVTGLAGNQIAYNFTLFGTSSDRDGSERTRVAVKWLDQGMNVVDGATGATTAAVRDANGLVLIDLDDRIVVTRTLPGANILEYAIVREEVGGAGEALNSASGGFGSITFFYNSPLVLDLNADGVQTVGLEHGVAFDMNADGHAEQTGWSDSRDGFLVLDRNGDGAITSGAELFGDHTVLTNGNHASDGFAALAEFDANGDGTLNAQDAVFASLQVWVDENTDGVSQAGELHGLAEVGVAEIHLAHHASDRVQNGNLMGLIGSYTDTQGQSHEMIDVWFATAPAKPLGEAATLATADLLHTTPTLDALLPADSAEPLEGALTPSPVVDVHVTPELLSLTLHAGLHREPMSEAAML